MKKQIFTLMLLFISVVMNAQNIYTIAGGGTGVDGTAAAYASLSNLVGAVAMDNAGNIYIPDNGNHRIRKIDAATGIISTVAGTGMPGYNGDGISAVSAQLNSPGAVALDTSGNIYIADYSNNRIRKVDVSTGLISTVAGTGVYGYNGDTIPAISAKITESTGIGLDNSGNIYFSDLGNSRIRKVDVSSGFIYTVAGNGNHGYNGDGISALSAQVNFPYGITVDTTGNIYIADKENHRIRKVDVSTGFISTIAGNGSPGYSGDGISADTANLYHPLSVSLDLTGNFYIADSWSNRIRKVDTSGIISTIAGNGTAGYLGDGGAADSAQLNSPRGVYVDVCGNIYISDFYNQKVRKVTFFNIFVVSSDVTCNGDCSGIVSVSASGGTSPFTYFWNGGVGAGANHSNVCAGNYSVTATGADGCMQSLSVSISEPSAIDIVITTINDNCLGSGSASATATGGASPYTYLWQNGDTSSMTTGLSSGNYILTVTDTVGCIVTQAFSIVNDSAPFSSVPICLVTVDSLSQYNIVVWDKTPYSNVDSFFIYREISTNNYQLIAGVPFDSLSQFVDTVRTLYFPNTGDPNAGTYRYKIQMRDSCGNYSQMSSYHNTLFILNNNGIFSWPQLYTIENGTNPVSSYVLMRDDSSNGNWQAVNSVAGTQQFITDPQYPQYENIASWRISTQWNLTCSPTLKVSTDYGSSLSNIYANSTSSINEFSLENYVNFYPNPTDGKIFVNSSNLKILNLEIYSIIGELLFSANRDNSQNTMQINLLGFERGVYFLSVKTANGIVVKKILKE